MRSAMMCAGMWWSTWATRTRCWWSMKRETSRRAGPALACSASIRAPRGGWRTARSRCFCPMLHPPGHALIDRELYLPRSWAADSARCAAAGIPAGTGFATKPKLARRMIARALDTGIPGAWVTGDEVYGADPGLRADLEYRRVGYVLAVAASHPVI